MSQPLKRILYVEDDDDIAEITQMTLAEFGSFDVYHCPSGRSALAELPVYKPQLVLMDVMMPNMDGPETFRQMRQMPEGADVPVVFMTAKAQTHEQAAYMKLGASGVIVKPFDPMTLCEQINAIWEKVNG